MVLYFSYKYPFETFLLIKNFTIKNGCAIKLFMCAVIKQHTKMVDRTTTMGDKYGKKGLVSTHNL